MKNCANYGWHMMKNAQASSSFSTSCPRTLKRAWCTKWYPPPPRNNDKEYKVPESHPRWPRWPWPWWSWLWWSWPWLPWSRWSRPCTIVHLQMEGMAEARSSPPTYRSSIMNTSVVSSFNTFQSWILQWSFINHEYWILQYSITFNHQYFNGLLSIMIHEYWILQYPITFNHEYLNIFYLIYSRALDTIPSLQHTGKTCNKT